MRAVPLTWPALATGLLLGLVAGLFVPRAPSCGTLVSDAGLSEISRDYDLPGFAPARDGGR